MLGSHLSFWWYHACQVVCRRLHTPSCSQQSEKSQRMLLVRSSKYLLAPQAFLIMIWKSNILYSRTAPMTRSFVQRRNVKTPGEQPQERLTTLSSLRAPQRCLAEKLYAQIVTRSNVSVSHQINIIRIYCPMIDRWTSLLCPTLGTTYIFLSSNDHVTRSLFAPVLVTKDNTGYLQPKFGFSCESCKSVITREYLALAKFIRDMILDYKGSENNKQSFFRYEVLLP